jgi:hypothetical protein
MIKLLIVFLLLAQTAHADSLSLAGSKLVEKATKEASQKQEQQMVKIISVLERIATALENNSGEQPK